MSSNNKRIAKNTLMLYIRMFFIMIVSLYTSRVILKTLGIEDFGIYNVVGGIVSMFSFLNGTMSGATQRFLTFELGLKENGNFSKVFGAVFTIHTLLALIIFILAETVGIWFVSTQLSIPPERFSAALWVYHFSILSTIIFVISIPFNACIISYERMGAFAYISILEVSLKLLLILPLSYIGFDKLKLYAMLMFFTQIGIQFTYMIFCHKSFPNVKISFIWDKSLLSKIAQFAGWSLFGGMASVGFTQGLNIILNLYFGPIVNAARAIAIQVDNAIQSFVLNFQMAMNPQIIKRYAAGEYGEMENLIFASSRYSFYLMLLFAVPIYLETPTILELWLEHVPDHTVNFLRITIFVILLNTLSNPLITSVNATGNVKKYQIIIGSILLSIVPIAYLVLRYKSVPELAFVVYLLISIIAQAFRFILAKKLVCLTAKNYLKRVLLPIFSVGCMSIIVPIITSFYIKDSLISLVLTIIISWISVILATYTLGIGASERHVVNNYIKTFF